MRLFVWSDSPLAPTGFGRSANHVLFALHEEGHEIVQLAVNCDSHTVQKIPWEVHLPTNRNGDPYGLQDLADILKKNRFDGMWTTFDPEIPWFYKLGNAAVIDVLCGLRVQNPGFKTAGWFPVDGGPLSDQELAVLGMGNYFDAPVTMSPHVYDLVEWTLKLKGAKVDRASLENRLRVIPHGVDVAKYKVPTEEERRAAKEALGLPPDAFIVTQIERNQQRKQNYLALEVMEILRKRKLDRQVVLYQHMAPNEETAGCQMGFDLPQLAWRYGLKAGQDVFWPPGFVSEEDLLRVYLASDTFLSVSTGEGFQYPAWEALAGGIPIVVPNDSARRAWFSQTSNVYLYRTAEQRIVMRGGYRRRMNFADPADAARKIRKLVEKPPSGPQREFGRRFVEKTADLNAVKQAWVDVMGELETQLDAERGAMKIALPGEAADKVLGFRHRPGVGDLIMAGPALKALRASNKVKLHVPRDLLEAATICGIAEVYSTEPLPAGATDLSDLFAPHHRLGWSDPTKPRAEVFAERLGVQKKALLPIQGEVPPEARKQAAAQFLEGFGVSLGNCVALCLESGNPTRSMPGGYLPQLVAGIKALDAVPVLVGKQPRHCRLVGTIDMTGQTDLGTALALLGQFAAVVTVDSGTFHMAALQGTPVVGCFTLFAPEARAKYYSAPMELLCPTEPIGDHTPPIGLAQDVKPTDWWAQIPPSKINAAVRRLLGADKTGEEVTRW